MADISVKKIPSILFIIALICTLCDSFVMQAMGQGDISSDLDRYKHPYLLFTSQEMPALRNKATENSLVMVSHAGSELWASIKNKADGYLNEGSFEFSVFIPGYNSAAGIYNDAGTLWSYVFSNQDPPGHNYNKYYPPWTGLSREIEIRMVHLSFAYVITGDIRYAQMARRMLLDIIQWRHWTDPDYSNYGKACLDTAHIVRAVSLTYDWIYDALSPAERALIAAALKEKGLSALSDDSNFYFYDNCSEVFAASLGLGALAIKEEFPEESQRWLTKAMDKIKYDLDAQGADGGFFEGPFYATYGLDSIALFFIALDKAGIKNELLSHRAIELLPRFALSLLPPAGKYPHTFGDSVDGLISFPVMMNFLSLKGANGAGYYLKQVGSLLKESTAANPEWHIIFFILDKNEGTGIAEPLFNPSSVFKDIGYGVLRDGFLGDSPALFFKCGPQKRKTWHNQYDHNSFMIYYNGQWLTTDPGYADYIDLMKKKFSFGSLGHNTVVLDMGLNGYLYSEKFPSLGREQVSSTGGEITNFFSSNNYDFIRGNACQAYNQPSEIVMDEFGREIIYLKPDYFIIRDTLNSPTRHNYTFLLHGPNIGYYKNGIVLNALDSSCYVRVFSADGIKYDIISAPGAEDYGKFLAATTMTAREKTAITSLLYPSKAVFTVLNPGFEDGLDGWCPRYAKNHHIDTAIYHSGTKSARITLGGKDDGTALQLDKSGYFYSNGFVLPEGSSFTAVGYCKTDMQSGYAYLRVIYSKLDGEYLSDAVSEVLRGVNDWTKLTVASTVPKGASKMMLSFEFGDGKGAIWVDDASIASKQWSAPEMPSVESLGNSKDGLVITTPKGKDIILFNPENSPRLFSVSAEQIYSDAKIVIIRKDNAGGIVSAFLKDGALLSIDGEIIISSPEPAVISVERPQKRVNSANDLKRAVSSASLAPPVSQAQPVSSAPSVPPALPVPTVPPTSTALYAAGVKKAEVYSTPTPQSPASDNGKIAVQTADNLYAKINRTIILYPFLNSVENNLAIVKSSGAERKEAIKTVKEDVAFMPVEIVNAQDAPLSGRQHEESEDRRLLTSEFNQEEGAEDFSDFRENIVIFGCLGEQRHAKDIYMFDAKGRVVNRFSCFNIEGAAKLIFFDETKAKHILDKIKGKYEVIELFDKDGNKIYKEDKNEKDLLLIKIADKYFL